MILTVKDNILIRNLTAEDAPEVYAAVDANREYLRKWLPWVDATNSPSVIEGVINEWANKQEKGSDIVFGIFKDGGYIGNIGLHHIDIGDKTAVIGYWLAESAQGGGVMTDCVRTLVEYAVLTLGINTVSIHCASGNSKSRAIPERLGFKQTGILKDGIVLYGVPYERVIYSLEKQCGGLE